MNKLVARTTQNYQMHLSSLINIFRIPNVMSVIGNRLLSANLTKTFFTNECFKTNCLPLVRFKVLESVGMFAFNTHWNAATIANCGS